MLAAMFEYLDPVLGSAQCGRERPPVTAPAQRKVRFVVIDSLSTVAARHRAHGHPAKMYHFPLKRTDWPGGHTAEG